ncbi:MAG TPA: hypothetical protein VEA40_12965 [Ramlibacter sp.]|nr:hypothetical protein [Ramlibacter sp.]
MKIVAVACAAAILVGCASSSEMAALGQAVRHVGDAALANGAGTGAGSVGSGGTGYLPCAVTPGGRRIESPDCK